MQTARASMAHQATDATFGDPTAPAPLHDDVLRRLGLRATRQRLALMSLLFAQRPADQAEGPHRHVSAETLFAELRDAGAPGSISCVYNTLRRLEAAGLIRRLPVCGQTAWYDTDMRPHPHFYLSDRDELVNVPPGRLGLAAVSAAMEGYDMVQVELILRLRPTPCEEGSTGPQPERLRRAART